MILISEFYSEDTKRKALVYKTDDVDYMVLFHDDGVEVGHDWRETLEIAEESAEDWVLSA